MKDKNIRRRFFFWVKQILRHPEGQILSVPLRILFVVLFPLKSILLYVGEREGYRWQSNVWLIYGIRYTDELFRHFAFGDGSCFRIVKRENGIVTVERCKEGAS